MDLRRFDAIGWRTAEQDLDAIVGDYLTRIHHTALVTPAMIRSLRQVDARSFQAALVGCNPAGLYQVD